MEKAVFLSVVNPPALYGHVKKPESEVGAGFAFSVESGKIVMRKADQVWEVKASAVNGLAADGPTELTDEQMLEVVKFLNAQDVVSFYGYIIPASTASTDDPELNTPFEHFALNG